MKKKRKLVWTSKAQKSLETLYYCIEKDSPQNAKKVKAEIFKSAKKLLQDPEIYQIDEYYPSNPGNIRRFFNWSYRTVYEVREEVAIILNIYHTGINPLKIKP